MEPYYQDDLVTLYHGDSTRDVDAWLQADVLVTDPPYGMAYQSGARKITPTAKKVLGDESAETRDEILRLWGPTKPAAVFGTWRVEAPAGERSRVVWFKAADGPGMGDLKIPWGSTHEELYILGDGWDVGATSHKRAQSVITTHVQMSSRNGVVAQSGHPTAKPVGLLEHIIDRTPPGTIADPCAGGGSTLIAARNLGRRSIGVEMDRDYCDLIVRRLAQSTLFGGVA